ncbi:hypothetical protein HC928_08005 [bacterium]|nr:hypothetical protein [bacterium]
MANPIVAFKTTTDLIELAWTATNASSVSIKITNSAGATIEEVTGQGLDTTWTSSVPLTDKTEYLATLTAVGALSDTVFSVPFIVDLEEGD